MGHQKSTYLANRPLPTGRLWLALGVAWLAALTAAWLRQSIFAAALSSAGLVLVATLGLNPIRRAFAREQGKLVGLLNTAPEGVLEIDAAGRIVFANPPLCALFGYEAHEILGQPVEILVPPALRGSHVGHRAEFWASARSRSMGSGLDIAGMRKDGTLVPIDISLNRVQTRRDTAMYCMVRDISARKAFENQLMESNQRLTTSVAALERSAFELRTLTEMGELLHSSNDERELHGIVAHTMERLFPDLCGALYTLGGSGRTSLVATWGKAPHAPASGFACSECWAMRRGRPHCNGLSAGRPRCAHLDADAPAAGVCVPLLGHGELLGVLQLGGMGEAGLQLESPARLQLLQALANQIALSSANLRLRETLRVRSTIDPLTGIHNRRVLDEYLDSGIRAALAERREVALLLLDIDHFKSFNDRHGHDCGDIALREVATLLRRSLRPDDILCRMGGEEFAIALPGTLVQDAERIAEKLRQSVEALQLRRDGHVLAGITVSIGVAALRPQGDSAPALLRRADRALYRAKDGGRNRVTVAGPGEETGVHARVSMLPLQA